MDLRKAIGDLLRSTLSDVAGGWFSGGDTPAQDLKDAAASLKQAGDGLRKGYAANREELRAANIAQLQAAGATQQELAAIMGPGHGVQSTPQPPGGGGGGGGAAKVGGMAMMLRGMKGAARGARMAGGGIGAAVGGPIGFAAGVIGAEIVMQFAERLIAAGKAVVQFASNVEQGNRAVLSQYSAGGARAYAISDMRQIMRDFRAAQKLEASGVGVVAAGERFRESLQPYRVAWGKFGNQLAKAGYGVGTYALEFGPLAGYAMAIDSVVWGINSVANLLGVEGDLLEGILEQVTEQNRGGARDLQGGAAFHRELMSAQFRNSGAAERRQPLDQIPIAPPAGPGGQGGP